MKLDDINKKKPKPINESVISDRERRLLRRKGFADSKIDKMTPEEARQHLGDTEPIKKHEDIGVEVEDDEVEEDEIEDDRDIVVDSIVTVKYDDGEPVTDTPVNANKIGKDGKIEDVVARAKTNEKGEAKFSLKHGINIQFVAFTDGGKINANNVVLTPNDITIIINKVVEETSVRDVIPDVSDIDEFESRLIAIIDNPDSDERLIEKLIDDKRQKIEEWLSNRLQKEKSFNNFKYQESLDKLAKNTRKYKGKVRDLYESLVDLREIWAKEYRREEFEELDKQILRIKLKLFEDVSLYPGSEGLRPKSLEKPEDTEVSESEVPPIKRVLTRFTRKSMKIKNEDLIKSFNDHILSRYNNYLDLAVAQDKSAIKKTGAEIGKYVQNIQLLANQFEAECERKLNALLPEEEKSSKPGFKSQLTDLKNSLRKIYDKALENSAKMYVDDLEGQAKYEQELNNDYYNYKDKLLDLKKKALEAEYDSENAKSDSIKKQKFAEFTNISKQLTQTYGEFKSKYVEEKPSKTLKDSEYKDQKWYREKLVEYQIKARGLPSSPASTGETLDILINKNKFVASKAKYPEHSDPKQAVSDKALIDQVIRGVIPLAHTQSSRREVKLNREEAQRIAYVLAPAEMGGGVIWYKPYQRSNEKPYGPEIVGYSDADKKADDRTKAYDPLKKDENFEIVRLYMWNNIVNRSDPKIYNFINGLCLGYHKDYVIWFCESKYGKVDHRQPAKTFWGSLLDRFRYTVRAGVDGYGRPGTIQPDGMFSKIFKTMTPKFINTWVDTILGSSSDINVGEHFASTVDQFKPEKIIDNEEETNTQDDSVVESIFKKLDNL